MRNRKTTGLPTPLSELLKPALERVREDRLWVQIRARRANGMGGHSEPPRAGQYLPVPVTIVLNGDESVSERSRLWRGIRARQHQAQKSRSLSRSFKLPLLGFGLATAMAAVLVLAGLVPLSPQVAATVAQPKPLMLAITGGGRAPVRTIDATRAPQILNLTDGSEIRLAKGARLEPLLSSGSRFELLLRQGSAEFSVTPGGPRRWMIEAGLATVEVVGTVFRVNRTDQGVEVSVSRGTVIVRGERVPDRVQRLTAGHSISVVQKPLAPAPAPLVTPIGPAAAPGGHMQLEEITLTATPLPAATTDRVREAATRQAKWRGHVEQGEFATAYAALGDKGLLRETMRTDDPQELLALADVARLSGHPAAAVKPLDRLIALHPQSPHAALAAFTLGRVYLDQLRQPADAARAFEQVIGMRPPHALLADCHTRLVEAYARAGDRESAERAASRYRTLFPTGRQLSDLSVWTQH